MSKIVYSSIFRNWKSRARRAIDNKENFCITDVPSDELFAVVKYLESYIENVNLSCLNYTQEGVYSIYPYRHLRRVFIEKPGEEIEESDSIWILDPFSLIRFKKLSEDYYKDKDYIILDEMTTGKSHSVIAQYQK